MDRWRTLVYLHLDLRTRFVGFFAWPHVRLDSSHNWRRYSRFSLATRGAGRYWHNYFNQKVITKMDNDPELDPIRKEVDEDALLEDLAEEFMNGDPDDALARAEELGYDIDDLPL